MRSRRLWLHRRLSTDSENSRWADRSGPGRWTGPGQEVRVRAGHDGPDGPLQRVGELDQVPSAGLGPAGPVADAWPSNCPLNGIRVVHCDGERCPPTWRSRCPPTPVTLLADEAAPLALRPADACAGRSTASSTAWPESSRRRYGGPDWRRDGTLSCLHEGTASPECRSLLSPRTSAWSMPGRGESLALRVTVMLGIR
jgi:hypothetical protein